MRFSVSQDSLINGISMAGRAVTNKSTMPILECILLEANDGYISITGNDLELAIKTAPIEADVQEPGVVALDARMFSDIVRKLPGPDVDITVDHKHMAIIKSQKVDFKIMGQSGENYPAIPTVEGINQFEINPADFRDMIRQTVFAVSVDGSKPALTGELIEIKDGRLNVVAVDGFRIAYRHMAYDTGQSVKVIVPGKSISEVSKLLSVKGTLKVYFSNKHILFESESNTVVSRLLDGDFVSYENLFKSEPKTTAKVVRSSLLDSLERATIVGASDKKIPVKMALQGDCINISSNTESGAAHEEIEADIDGDELEIAFNPRYFMDALKAVDDEEVTICFTGSLNPCIIRSDENDNYRYLVLPLRLKG